LAIRETPNYFFYSLNVAVWEHLAKRPNNPQKIPLDAPRMVSRPPETPSHDFLQKVKDYFDGLISYGETTSKKYSYENR
jgi:hypothetical protein